MDDFSRSILDFLMKNKSETKPLIHKFISYIETNSQPKSICILSNQGLEFNMPEFYAAKGMLHQISCISTPQQNSVFGRKHKHILNVARAFHFQAKLATMFCSACVLHAVHLINRTLPLFYLTKLLFSFCTKPYLVKAI